MYTVHLEGEYDLLADRTDCSGPGSLATVLEQDAD